MKRFFTILSIVIIAVLGSAGQCQSMSVGDYGEPCTSEGTCYLGLYCNSATLCERCGGSGEPICPGEPCVEGLGWVPVPLGGDSYCVYLGNDFQFRQNCGFSGYLMCPGSNTCRGVSIPLQGTRLCVDCGMLGQRCCEGNTCPQEMNAVCVSGRCRPPTPTSSASRPNDTPIQNAEPLSITNLTGDWSAGKGSLWHISQDGKALTVSHKGRVTFSGRFTSMNTIEVKFTDDQGCCTANVETSGNTLNWSNQTTWTRTD